MVETRKKHVTGCVNSNFCIVMLAGNANVGKTPFAALNFIYPVIMMLGAVGFMLGTGGTLLKAMEFLKGQGATKVICAISLPFFTGDAIKNFDEAYEKGIITGVLTTNLMYQTPELLQREWYINCDMSKYIALLIDTLNHDGSISDLLEPYERINAFVAKYKEAQQNK